MYMQYIYDSYLLVFKLSGIYVFYHNNTLAFYEKRIYECFTSAAASASGSTTTPTGVNVINIRKIVSPLFYQKMEIGTLKNQQKR